MFHGKASSAALVHTTFEHAFSPATGTVQLFNTEPDSIMTMYTVVRQVVLIKCVLSHFVVCSSPDGCHIWLKRSRLTWWHQLRVKKSW